MLRFVLFFLLIERKKLLLRYQALLDGIAFIFLRCIGLIVLIINICSSVHRFRIIFLVKVLGLALGLPALIARNIAHLLLSAPQFVYIATITRIQGFQIVPVGSGRPLLAASVQFLTVLLGHTS
jgi:hypothetical protein